MDRRTRVPIRVKRQELERRPRSPTVIPVEEAIPPVIEAGQDHTPAPEESSAEAFPLWEELEMWRDRALRLEAEIDNFRKRQRRLAEDHIAADRERLLQAFLKVTDDLARALSSDGVDVDSLREGVHITHQGMMLLLDQEGVEPVEAEGESFDPTLHEAIGTVNHEQAGVEPDVVVEVVQSGYRLGNRLLRPAQVIVAT